MAQTSVVVNSTGKKVTNKKSERMAKGSNRRQRGISVKEFGTTTRNGHREERSENSRYTLALYIGNLKMYFFLYVFLFMVFLLFWCLSNLIRFKKHKLVERQEAISCKRYCLLSPAAASQ